MKRIIEYVLVVALSLFAMGCEKEDATIKRSGRVTFSFQQKDLAGGRVNATGSPASIYFTVENNSGQTVLQNRKLALLGFGNGYVTENISLEIGSYKITSFIVANEDNQAIYATPVAGSPKANLVNTPLPISFVIAEGGASQVTPEVLEISSTDTPDKFGYASFGFDVVDPDKLNVSVKVELTVGEIDYLDVDTKIKVTAFDANNQLQWSQEYAYIGPADNVIQVKKGFHHYEFAINHWGITDKQTMTGAHLEEGAAGEVPVTYVLGGARQPKKVSHYITYTEHADPNEWGATYFTPTSKVEYEYGVNGKPSMMRAYGFVDSLDTFVEHHYFIFHFAGARLTKISGYWVGHITPYIEDFYTYGDDGKVSKIQSVNYAGGVTSEANIIYNYTDRLIKAAYTYSNGGSFEYEFNYVNKNIFKDKTTRLGGLCSTGSYAYDKNINPLAHLGYLDYSFRNYSINNKIGENVNYTGCAFPSYIPEAFEYKYDGEGFPTEQKIRYKSSNLASMTQYFYQ